MTTERETNRRGNYSMFMGVFATAIIGFGALGVDISYIAMTNNQAQAVSDAASHAALIAYRYSDAADIAGRKADGIAAANHVVQNNFVGLGERGNLNELKFGQFNPNTGNFNADAQPYNAAYAQVDRKAADALQLFLAPVIGQNTADVSQSGITASNPREIVVVVDKSCSMAWPAGWSGGYQGWEGVRDALGVFSVYMVDHQVPQDKLGVAWFSASAGQYDPLRYVDGNEADILDMWGNWGYCTRDGGWAPAGTPSGNDVGEDLFACSGNTDQRDGVNVARTMLDGSDNELAFKAMIVISDGNPTACSDNDFKNATAAAWDDGYHVWTVSFGDDIDHTLMEDATRGIGTYHHAPSAEGLEGVMLDIARSIPVVVVD